MQDFKGLPEGPGRCCNFEGKSFSRTGKPYSILTRFDRGRHLVSLSKESPVRGYPLTGMQGYPVRKRDGCRRVGILHPGHEDQEGKNQYADGEYCSHLFLQRELRFNLALTYTTVLKVARRFFGRITEKIKDEQRGFRNVSEGIQGL
ncbi:MAG TPA: hypothetical protein PLV84_00320 [Deltaproteobacteria bacterium]|nr:hypothetical protein [Deltaproteobacteria bacterium]